MSVHRSFSWHIKKEFERDLIGHIHMKPLYSSIYGKEIYPVAIHCFEDNSRYSFLSKAKYEMK